jgi:ATP-dependent exoDNAse (exonuclease V) beta subunit
MCKNDYRNVHHITAGAGAGKTTELVRIITRLVNEGKDPQRMILTTYTVAAATEFREKSKAALTPDKAVQMNGALMGTLHSIASRYINRYWYLLGISPTVKPVSESVSGILMDRSLDGLVTGEQKALLNTYVETFGLSNGDEGLDFDFWKETLKKLFGKMRGYGFGKEKISEFRERTMNLLRDTFKQDGNQPLFESLRPDYEKYLKYSTISTLFTDAGQKQFGIDCAQIQKILKIDPLKVKKSQLEEIGDMKWGNAAKIAKKGLDKDRFDPELAAAKEALKSATKQLSQGLVPVEYSMIFEVAELLFNIMEAWMDAYVKIKKETGVIDFADMEELFLLLLGKNEVKDDIQASVDYLFVDEFQDSTPIQAQIYEILSNYVKQSWFVGDRKQAIYGFAGSDAGLVAELVKTFPKPEEDAASTTLFKKDDNGNSSQVLDTSYRSTPKLVNAANEIFIKAFGENTGNPKDVIPEEHVRLKPCPKNKDTAWGPLYHVTACPQNNRKKSVDEEALAEFICRMAADPGFKQNGYDISDIAILTRFGSQATRIGKALVKKGIPTGFVDPKGFMDTPEVSLVLAILRLSAGIDREKSRAEIRKLVVGEDLEKLSERVGKKENNLDDFPGLEGFAKALRSHSVLDRVNEIVTRFDLVGIGGQWGNPDSRRGNLNLLRKAAEEYASKSAILCVEADVRGFLSFLKDYKTDAKFDNSAAGVKVLTCHKSKGLDWKIVFLCGLDEYKEEETIGGVSVLGPSTRPESILVIPRLPDTQWVRECIQANPVSKDALNERRAVKRGEEKRLLYVGFTRAKDVVITVAMNDDPEVLRVLCPTVRERAVIGPVDDAQVDIWGVPGLFSRYGAFQQDPAMTAPSVAAPERYKEAGLLLPKEPVYGGIKYHSPSKYKDPAVQTVADVEDMKYPGHRTDIPHGHLDDNVFGDCIHHIFARCAPDNHNGNLAVAASTLEGYGIHDADAAGKVVAAIEDFFVWLEGKYSSFTSLEREVPFQYTDAKGQVFSGNMDLVWRTANGCVLVDYKTFPGAKAELFNPGSKHWAGNYASQLSVYADALSASPWGKPLARLLYYPVEGVVVKVKEK